MVYRRRFRLCKLCFVSKIPTLKKEHGFILVHYPFTDVSQENLAKGKPSNQSSTFTAPVRGSASSNLAVDGIWEARLQLYENSFTCTHTAVDQQGSWWIVNLEHIYPVSKVVVLNRADCCWDRLRNVTITVGETESDMQLCHEYPGPGGPGERLNIPCRKPLLEQFVRISKFNYGPLQLCEVGVYR